MVIEFQALPSLAIEPTNTFLITFLFVFAIVFGLLSLAKVFKNKVVNSVVSLAIALFAASYQPFVDTLFSYLPGITGLFIVMFFIAFMLELFGLRRERRKEEMGGLIIVAGVVLLLLFTVGSYALQSFDITIPFIGNAENIVFLVGIVIILIIIAVALKFGFGLDLVIASKVPPPKVADNLYING